MKLTAILLFATCLQVSAKGYAQSVTLSEKNATLEKVFRKIKNQSGYTFVYRDEWLKKAGKVDIDLQNAPIEQALEACFKNQPLTYTLVKTTVVVRLKPTVGIQPTVTNENPLPPPIEIKGKITDDKGQPLEGATILVKGTNNGTKSGANGNFSINAEPNSVLVISYVSFETTEVKIGNQANVFVQLKPFIAIGEEVVVVGYGTQKKSSVIGAVATMKSEDVKDIPVPNLSNALAGRLSGVFVNQASGAPGIAASIRVRSINSWKNNGLEPLYVIDGIISDKRSFDVLDYSEVDNITVLKDAASGAIYGARAANGVILVTTKTGAVGKFKLNYNYSYSFDNPSKIPEYTSNRDMIRTVNYATESAALPPVFDAQEAAYLNENDPGRAWYTLAYRNPVLQKHSLTASGGTEKVKYFLSGSYFDQTAFIKNADYKKYNFRSNIDVNFTKNLSGIFNISYSQGTNKRFASQVDLNGYGGVDFDPNFGNLWGRLLYSLPNVPPKTSDGKFINPGWIGNPLAFIEEGGTNTRLERNIKMLLELTYKVPFVNGLSVSGKYSPNYEGATRKLYEVKPTLYNVVQKGTSSLIYTDDVLGSIKSPWPDKERIAKFQETTSSYQMNFSASYVKEFRKHNVDAILVYEQSEGKQDNFFGVREGFSMFQRDQFWATSSARNDSYVNGGESEYGRASYIGRILYSYDKKYFVNITTRRDGSMLFAPDHRWGIFPSFSAGWLVSKENFFNVKFIDFLKLRGSWGLAGNDAVGGWKWSESYSVNGNYLLGTSAQPRVIYNGIVNKNLTWEKTRELNIGLDLRLFKGFLFTAEYYKRHNYDILDSRITSLPVSFGGSMPPENYGIVDAHGYELELGYTGNLGKVRYGVKGNFAYSTNKVKLRDVAQNTRNVDNPNGRPTDYIKMLIATDIIRTQKELDALPAGYTIYGLKPKLGALNFEDISGQVEGVPDGKIDDYDRQILKGKHTIAPYTFGLNLNANWKGLGANIFLQGVTGISKLFQGITGIERRFVGWNQRSPGFWADSWSPDNINAAYPKPVTWDGSMDHLPSTFWLKNGSFLRLQYINLTYSLPKSICERIKISDVTFILSGTNLLTLTKFDYHDPSVGGMDSYPTMKTYTMGVNVTF